MIKFREPETVERKKQHHFVMRSTNTVTPVICDYNIGNCELRIAGDLIGVHPEFTNIQSFIDWCTRYVSNNVNVELLPEGNEQSNQ